jgi:hypothetical protein
MGLVQKIGGSMDAASILALLVGKWPVVGLICSILGALVVVGQAVVAVTPSTADDAAWEKLKSIPVLGAVLAALANLAPIQKK